ncbi:putative outer membrane starch-binding protein [Chitinophaga japonensis]|uniref:Putative outer membrane starch-binding protein n=2 Tax=Chitinophaga japonensis TaxID=104662 RepID=A0A562SMH0_CHIJA|nr:putative outer membrane starch-binding protein [Chitinophaga japonensis]
MFMKQAIILLTIIVLTACKKDFLDRAATTQQQDEDIFTNFTMTDQVVNNLYSRIRGPYTYLGGYSMSSATDEGKDASSWMASQTFNNGSWNATTIGNTWRENYVALRQANTILENVVKYNTPDDPNNPGTLENRIGEVYFLRAWFLAELIKQFGGVIIVTQTMDQTDSEALNRPRNTYDSCVAQVLADCDEAFKRLPLSYPSTQVGRVTKGACLALKARALLYAASPLWAIAGKTSFQGDISSNSTASDPEKWRKAAAAAKAVIDLQGDGGPVYRLEPNLAARKQMFTSTTLLSNEVIFQRMRETDQGMDRYLFPFGNSGWSGCAPTQNLVDDYEMDNGFPVTDPASGYDPSQPYAHRDPRFYQDILYNDADFKGRKIETFAGGKDALSTDVDHTRTGYFARKLLDENITPSQSSSVRQVHGIIFRLAEFYLGYAEALNEYDPGNPDIATYVNAIRARAGMPPLPAGLSQPDMRQRIRNERRIELAFENHRFWDVRRWKIAEQTERAIYGLQAIVDNTAPGGFRYERFKVEDRPWRNAMYIIPITVDETLRNPNLVQNEGW